MLIVDDCDPRPHTIWTIAEGMLCLQGIPESAARIILGNCCWAPAGVVCKSVFLYWQERRQGRPLQGFGADHLWQRTWPSIWQPTHPLAPLAATLVPTLGAASRQPAESVLSNRLSPEGSQVSKQAPCSSSAFMETLGKCQDYLVDTPVKFECYELATGLRDF